MLDIHSFVWPAMRGHVNGTSLSCMVRLIIFKSEIMVTVLRSVSLFYKGLSLNVFLCEKAKNIRTILKFQVYFNIILNQNTAKIKKTNCSAHISFHSVAKLHGILSENLDFNPKGNSSRLLRMFLIFIQTTSIVKIQNL